MARTNHNLKTIKLLKYLEWFYWGVEQFNGFTGRKTDLYHIIDYVVITNHATIGIQSCGADFAPHIKKLLEEETENTIKWLSCKNRYLFLIGWRKVLLRRGLKRQIFKPRIGTFYLDESNNLLFQENDSSYFEGKI